MPAKTRALWRDARKLIKPTQGVLVLDDSVLDKPYASPMDLIGWHWSSQHRRVVVGIDLMTLLWNDGHALVPYDFRIYHLPSDGCTKNNLFRAMLQVAHQRGMQPRFVAFDSWLGGLDHLKAVCTRGWHWLTRLKSNRPVNSNHTRKVPIRDVAILCEWLVMHLKGYGMIKVFRTVSGNGDADYWATDDLRMSEVQRQTLADQSWAIETYHRGLKQCCRRLCDWKRIGCALGLVGIKPNRRFTEPPLHRHRRPSEPASRLQTERRPIATGKPSQTRRGPPQSLLSICRCFWY